MASANVLTKSRTELRLERLQQLTQAGGYDVLALVPGPTLLYLTGVSYHLSERPIIAFIPPSGDPTMIVPQLELSKMADVAPFPIRFFSYNDAEGHLPAFEQACKALGLEGRKIGVEGLKMRVLEGQLIQRFAPNCLLTSADETIIQLRLHKDANEIALMRRAIAISETALDQTLPQLRLGMTERRIMNILLNAMSELGSGGNAFDPIVLSGANSALPHGVPSERPLQNGDLLLFDFGITIEGYPSDITRTFAIGDIDPELTKIYNLVLAANEAGIQASKPGVTAQSVDQAARQIISAGGYGKYFLHRLGHGLGLDIHEEPNIREGNAQILERGMVFTIEPGIYLSGKGGVRIEDNVVVTETGVDVLTTYPKQLRTLHLTA